MSAVQPFAIAVSGHVVSNPLQAVVDYLAKHGGTVAHYDFQAAAFRRIELELAWAASGQPVTQGLPAHNADASPL